MTFPQNVVFSCIVKLFDRKFLVFMPLVFSVLVGYGQSGNSNKHYFSVAVDFTKMYHNYQPGTLNISFPFTTTDYNGSTRTTSFNSNKKNPFNFVFNNISLDFKVGAKNHLFGFEIGGGDNCFLFTAGYQRILNRGNPLWGKVLILAGVDLAYYDYSVHLGAIDNRDVTISALGETIDPTFNYSTRYGTYTTNAQLLKINFEQNDFGLRPKFIFEYHPFEGKFFVSLVAGYFLPFSNDPDISFQQTDGSGHTGYGDSFNLKTAGLKTTVNNRPVSSTPYVFNGFTVGISVGYCAY